MAGRTRNPLLLILTIILITTSFFLASPALLNAKTRTARSIIDSPSTPVHRNFFLRGNFLLNWNRTSPGPFMSVVSGDSVSINLISDDALAHSWFLDFNGNNLVDTNEMPTFSGFFSSTTTFLNFTFTPVIGTNIPAAGNWTYKCSVHTTTMFGTFRVLPEQVSTTVTSMSVLSGSSVSSTGSITVDMRTFQASGSLAVTATNTTTSMTTFSKTYLPSGLQMFRPSNSLTYRVGFILNVAVAPYALSVNFFVQLTGLTASNSNLLTRNLDINGDGSVTIIDIAITANSFGARIGAINYNPKADFNADGVINIIDISIIAAQFGSKAFS